MAADFDVWSGIEELCREAGVDHTDTDAIRRAMCLPASVMTRALPGARQLLETLRDVGLRRVILTNAIWRCETDYWNDFQAQGLAGLFEAVISSVDAGSRKPHQRIFELALEVAAAPPRQWIMIGNSEVNDIAPAASLGMRTVRVAIEDERPERSQADFMVMSLAEAARAVESLVSAA